MFALPSDFEWLCPWSPISEEDRCGIEEELRREISDQHVLAGHNVVAIGKSDNEDDFLFATDCVDKLLAAVHLTWRVESDPGWPATAVYRTLEEWVEAMNADHVDYMGTYGGNTDD